MNIFNKSIKSFTFIDDEYTAGKWLNNCTLAELKDIFSIKGRLYVKHKYNCGGKTYKLANSDYEFHVFPHN